MTSQEKWPVEIFRYSINKGWELYQQKGPNVKSKGRTTISSSSIGKGKQSKTGITAVTAQQKQQQEQKPPPLPPKQDDDEEGITVAPRRGCVEVKKLRLRIHLFEKSNNQKRDGLKNARNSNSYGNNNNNNNQKTEAHTTVVRRRDRILLSNRRGLGAVVLKFRNVSECIAFSDKLIKLNSDYVFNQTDDKTIQRPVKRVKIVEDGRATTDDTHDTTLGSSQSSGGGSDAVRSYIVRLLHDEDFLDFVDNVENSLVSAPDCTRILEALEYPRQKIDQNNY